MRRIQWSDLIVIVLRSAFFDDDLGEQTAAVPCATRERAGRAPGCVEICTRAGRVRRSDHRGPAAIGFLANLRIERQLAEERGAVLLGHARTPARPEDVLHVPAARA